MKKIKIIIIGTVALGIFAFFGYYLHLFVFKPKAANEKVGINYYCDNCNNLQKNQDFNIMVTLNADADNDKKISGVDLRFKFDSDNKDLVDYIKNNLVVIPLQYFDEVLIESEKRISGAEVLRLAAVAKKPIGQLKSVLTLNLKFRTKQTDGQTSFYLLKNQSQIVGPVKGNYFEIEDKTLSLPINIGVGDIVSPTPTSTPGPSPTPTPTSPPSGNITLNLKLKFQGITKKPKITDKMDVKVKLGGNMFPEESENQVKTATFTVDDKGIWSGSVAFNTPPGSGYIIYLKGPKHIQKKICDASPTETSPGTYRCLNRQGITLKEGENNFDFSSIYLFGGDLPEQDGVVNAYDTSLIRNNLGKNDNNTLRLADVNLDGVVDSQDHSLIIYALSVKMDEE